MSGRNAAAWEVVFTLLALILVVLLGVSLYEALVTQVTVSLLWPLGSTAGMAWLGYLNHVHRHRNRLRATADAERAGRSVLDRPESLSAADVIRSCRAGHLIGDAERDVIVAALHAHFAAGRLAAAELDERLGVALAARTVEGLALALRDLPSEVTGR